jgi:hypothetical protein
LTQVKRAGGMIARMTDDPNYPTELAKRQAALAKKERAADEVLFKIRCQLDDVTSALDRAVIRQPALMARDIVGNLIGFPRRPRRKRQQP